MLENQLDEIKPQGSNKRSLVPVITVEEIFRVIRRRKYGMMLALMLSSGSALLYHFLKAPEYHAVSMLMINDGQDQSDLLSKVLGPVSGMNDMSVKKNAELIHSMPIAEQTVRELYRGNQNKGLELLGRRQYIAPLAMLIRPVLPVFAAQRPAQGVNSDEMLRRVALRLIDRIRIDPVRETNVIKVSVASPFPDEAAYLTNTLCRVYRLADISRNSEKYAQANRFVADMLVEQQRKVAEADKALSQYMSAHDIYEVTGNTQQLLEKLVEVDARYNDIQAEYNITRNSLDFLDSKLSEADKALSSRIAQNVSVELGSIMDEIRSNENDYIRLVNEKGIDAQEVKAKKQQLDVVKARYEQLNRSKIAGQIGYAGRAQKYSFDRVSEKLRIERKMNELNFSSREYNRLKQYYETQLKRLPAKQQEYVKLQRDRDAVSKTYVFLKEKLDETRILLGSEVGSVSVVGAAFQPLEPESPDLKKTMLLGLLLGGLCATVYAYSAESLDETIKEELFFRDNRLGRVFMVPFAGRKSRGSDQVSAGSKSAAGSLPVLKITEQLTSPFTESIRMIRAHLDHLSTDHSLQSILVSGTAIDEGTSTICANLGMAFALVGRKTLIVDCDLLRASQHTIFDCDREAGLSDYLMSSEATLEKGLLQQTHIDNLYVLGAGSQVANPSELLGSAKMEALLKTLAERFDAILLDCPPLFLSDSIRLTKLVDGILLVARMGYTRRKPLTDLALDEFFRSRILGVAVIDTASSVLKGYSRYDAVV